MELIKKVLSSKILRIFLSVILIFYAFRRVNILHLLNELTLVPVWFILLVLIYSIMVMFIAGIRWSVIVLEKPKFKDFWNFTRATWIGGFYSLFFPSSVAGDVLKWIQLLKEYPEVSKAKMVASVIVDRVIGLSAFVVIAFVALVAGKLLKYQFPDILFWMFGGLSLGVIVFYFLVFTIDFDSLLAKYVGRFKWLSKLIEVIDLLKSENKKRILLCFIISVFAEPIWMLPIWFYSQMFQAGISLLQVYIFLPIISLILVLPISVAGFGARENLYLAFFGPLGLLEEKILLVSTFGGLIGVLISLIGGVLLLSTLFKVKNLNKI